MYYYYKGQWRTLTDMQSIASAEDLSVDDFVKKYSISVKNQKPSYVDRNALMINPIINRRRLSDRKVSPNDLTTSLNQPIKTPLPEAKASELIDKTKSLGIYSYDLYGKDANETIENTEKAISDYESGVGNYIWSDQNANATDSELAVWYDHHNKRLDDKYSFLSSSSLEQVFTSQDEDAINLLKTFLPDEYNVTQLYDAGPRAGRFATGQIEISAGGESVILNTGGSNFLDVGLDDISDENKETALTVEKAKLFDFLERVEAKTAIDDVQQMTEKGLAQKPIYDLVSSVSVDNGGIDLSTTQQQELNYINAKDDQGNYIHNIFQQEEQVFVPGVVDELAGKSSPGYYKNIITNPYEAEYNTAVKLVNNVIKQNPSMNVTEEYRNSYIQNYARALVTSKKHDQFLDENIQKFMEIGVFSDTKTDDLQEKFNKKLGTNFDIRNIVKLYSGKIKDEKAEEAERNKVKLEIAKTTAQQLTNNPNNYFYTNIVQEALNNNSRVIDSNGEEIVQITRGDKTATVVKSIADGFFKEEQAFLNAKLTIDQAQDSYFNSLEQVEDAELAFNVYAKNYDKIEKLGSNLFYGTADLAMGISRTTTYATSFLMPKSMRQDIDDWFSEYQKLKTKDQINFYSDLETGDAFGSVSNFGEASMQVVTQQLPNLAAAIFLSPAGAATVYGLSTAGTKGIEMDYENYQLNKALENGQIDLEYFNENINGGGVYFSKMLGYGLTEGLITRYFGTIRNVQVGKKLITGMGPNASIAFEGGRRAYVKKNLPEIGYGTLHEEVEENLINVGQNLIDGRDIFANADYVTFSSGLFGFGMNSTTFTIGLADKRLSDYKAYKEMEARESLRLEAQSEIDQLKSINARIDSENIIQDNNNRILVLEENIQLLQEQNIADLDVLEKRYRDVGFTKQAWYDFRNGLVEMEQLRMKAENIAKQDGISQKQKEKQIKDIKSELNYKQKYYQVFTAVNSFGSRWASLNMNSSAFSRSGLSNRRLIKKYRQRASAELQSENATVSKEQVEKRAEKIYNEDQVRIYNTKTEALASQVGIDFKAFDDNKSLIKYLNETYGSLIETARLNGNEDLATELQEELDNGVEKIKKGTLNGLDIADLDQTVVSIENAANNGMYATSIHEISHAIARKALDISEEGFNKIGQTIVDYFLATDATMLQKMVAKNANILNKDGSLKDGEEAFATFMEFASDGTIDVDAIKAANLLGVLGFEVNEAMKQLGIDSEIDFTGQNQIFEFLKGVNNVIQGSKNVRDINIPNELRRGIASEDAKAKTSMSETGRPASVDQQKRKEDINKLVEESNLPESGTIKEWIQTPEGQRFAGKVLPRYYQDAYNTALRQRNLTTEEQLFDPSEIAQQTMLELLMHLGNFNVSNTDLDGYLAGYLGKKTGTAKKKVEKKIKTRATDTKDQGRMIAQETTTQVDNRKPTLLEEQVFEPTVLDQIKAKVSRIIPTIKQKVDQAVSKNKRTTPFIAQAKADISRLAEPIIKKAMGGKANNKLRDFLTGNKDAIVNNLTTTFLMGKDTKGEVLGGIPQAIQKSVGGEYQVDRFGNRVKDDNGNDIFVPKWLNYPDWVGKKADLEKAATTGRTSGADLVRRHPNVEEFVTDEDILSRFFTPEGELIRGRKEATAKQLANEVGLEIFEQDINEQGPIFDMFKDSQELQGVLLADNIAADIRRQIDRGGLKASEAGQIMTFFDENLNKNQAEQQVAFNALPEPVKQVMIDNGLDYLITSAVSGYRVPVMRVPWLGFEQYKDVYRETNMSKTGEGVNISMDQLADAVNKVVDNLDFSLFAGMTLSETKRFLHLSDRGLNLIRNSKKYKSLLNKIENKYNKVSDKQVKKFIKDNGFDPRDIRLFNASYGLFGKIQKILNTADTDKLIQIEDNYGNELAGANIANIRAVGYIYKQKLKTLVENESLTPGLIRMNEANTNNTKSVRMISRLGSVEVIEGIIQAPLIGPDGKGYSRKADAPKSVKDRLETNRNHPNFELANELAQYSVSVYVKNNPNATDSDIQNKYNAVLEEGLRYKGEHALASALLNYEITLKMFEYGTRIKEQPSQKENLLNQFEEEVLKISRDYDQELGTKAVFDLQDDALGRTSKLSFLRSRVAKILQDNFYSPINGDNKSQMQENQVVDREYYDKIAESKRETAKPNAKLRDDSRVIPKTRASETTAGMLGDFNSLDNALDNARSLDKPIKKIRVFDFDDTLAQTKSLVFYNRPNTTGKPTPKNKAIFMIGGPGSGKTNIGKGLQLGRDGWKVVNQDIFIEEEKKKAGLPESEREYTPEQRSLRGKIGAAGTKAAKAKLEKYTKSGDGMVIDGTGASYNATMKKVKALQDQGYEVFMIYAKTSNEVAQERNKARKERSLPAFVVKRTQESVNENVPKYKQDFGDNFIEIDTETLEYGKPLPKDFVADVKAKVHANERGRLTAEEFAEQGAELVSQGFEMDFSDFNIVREGSRGPMFKIAERIRDARGTEDIFVLTARAPESAPAIQAFLKSEGLDLPLQNITGLGNSTGEAKAQWLVGKANEGYNDFYFTDDAIQNVDAVSIAMEALDVKSKVQQARTKTKESLSREFNIILEQTTGVDYYKEFSKARAQTGVDRQRKFRGFMPASAQDFEGLLYRFLGKGEVGDRQYEWFKENLLDPLNRAELGMSQDRINLMNDFRTLKNNLSVPASLSNNAFDGFKNQDVVRMYIWMSQGMDVPGLSKSAVAKVKKHMEENPELITFAENIKQSLKGNEYTKPGEAWQAGTITTDLIETLNGNIRKGYLKEFKERADVIFSPENLNKIEAIYGPKFREALENSLARIKAGRNRIASNSRLTNGLLDYINNSQGVIMFLNMRSAVLQGISNINFLNWSFNNPIKAGIAFANQGQYWKDFMMLMNSDYLVDRRQGLRININEAEIANAAATSKNKAKAAVSWIIQKGYAPTTFMDSFAIASGGATFYRNRVNDLIKNEGLNEEQAEVKAMEDFREIAEKTQQSSRPDKISQQQAGDLGRIVLAFANTPMQYNRLINKAVLDLANGRGDYKTNISKIAYYGVIQNLIFNSLQQAVFALGFGDEETDEEKDKKYLGILEGTIDSILRGTGVGGAAIYTLKNVIMDLYERSERTRPEYVDAVWEVASFSPPIDSKISRLKQAAWYFDSKKRRQQMLDKGFSLDNPAYKAFAKVIAATTNVPLDRVITKIENINDAFASDTENWMRIAILLGWPKWTLETMADKAATKEQEDLEYKKKNLDQLNKWQQESMLKQYGITDEGLKYYKNEQMRVDAIEKFKEDKDTLYMPLDRDKPWYVKMKEEGASKEEIDEEKAKRKKIKPIKVLRL